MLLGGTFFPGTAKSGATAMALCQMHNYYLKNHFSSAAVLPYL